MRLLAGLQLLSVSAMALFPIAALSQSNPRSDVSGIGGDAKSALTADSLLKKERLSLPDTSASDHAENAAVNLQPFRTPFILKAAHTEKSDASYSESITLRDALLETLRHNLPIRISKESWRYQRYQLFANLAQFVPTFNLGYNLANSKISPGALTANAEVFTTQMSYPVFEGGSVLYNSLAQWYRNAGWRQAYRSNINDALLDVYNKYFDLVQQEAILGIRAHAVALSRATVDLNTYMYDAGAATQFDVMQARTQLSLDNDAFIQQQLTTRQASLELAYALNMPMSVNLVPRESSLKEANLFPNAEKMTITDYINLALNNRPELRQYELFRLAAARTVQTAAAPLYPAVSFFTTYADTAVTSNDTSGDSDSTLENAGVFTGTTKNFQMGFNLTWTVSNMGLLNAANVVSARALSRQAMMQANQELVLVSQQVRGYFEQLGIAHDRIDAAASAKLASREALKLANMRLKSGLGTNLELIQAQRSYITALINQVQSITASNKAQAGLLHATGLITVDRLIDGYAGDQKAPKKSRPLLKFW
ncbi:MAG TPA: TolC family protein [Candidatus Obscuribacterales bacterium]